MQLLKLLPGVTRLRSPYGGTETGWQVAKKPTIRFAFGTQELPASSPWRIHFSKHGDVYLNNVAPLGNEFHVSLHESGMFHFRMGSEKTALLGPVADLPSGRMLGPAIFFYEWEREFPAYPAHTEKRPNRIQWLGLPRPGHFFVIRLIYAMAPEGLNLHATEDLIGGPVPVKLMGKEVEFFVVAVEQDLPPSQVSDLKAFHPDTVFDLHVPQDDVEAIDMLRISTTDVGLIGKVSAIVHQHFDPTVVVGGDPALDDAE